MSWKIELVIGFFMFAAGINFAFYDLAVRTEARRGWNALWKSLEFRVYAGIVFGSVLLIATILWIWGGGGSASESGLPDYRHYPQALRDSFFQVISLHFYLISNRVAHCTEVNRDMRRIGHEFSLFIENGAGKIETFLNVGGNCGALQGASHLFSNRHKQVVEDGKLDRIQFSFNFLFGY